MARKITYRGPVMIISGLNQDRMFQILSDMGFFFESGISSVEGYSNRKIHKRYHVEWNVGEEVPDVKIHFDHRAGQLEKGAYKKHIMLKTRDKDKRRLLHLLEQIRNKLSKEEANKMNFNFVEA